MNHLPLRSLLLAAALFLPADVPAAPAPTGGFADLDASSGTLLPEFPYVDGEVYSITRHPTDGWILGGSFSSVGGMSRMNLAHVRADGTVSPWNPGTNGPVYAVHASSVEVFAGGSFTVLGGEARANLGKLHPNTGVVAAWAPNPDGVVRALVQLSSTLFVGGGFLNFASQPRMRLAALNTGTGVLSTWNPGADDTVFAMDPRLDPLTMTNTIYIGGKFASCGGASRSRLAAVRSNSSTADAWNPGADGTVFSIDARFTEIHVGGEFSTVGGATHPMAAQIHPTTAVVAAWNPSITGGIVRAIASDGTTTYLGGTFTGVAGEDRRGLAAVDDTTATLFDWNPDPDVSATYAILPLPLSGRVAVGGGFTAIGGATVDAVGAVPEVFAFSASPNPVRQTMTFEFVLPRSGRLALTVYDARGRIVARPLQGRVLDAGRHRIAWSPSDLAPGAYLAVAYSEEGARTVRLAVVR